MAVNGPPDPLDPDQRDLDAMVLRGILRLRHLPQGAVWAATVIWVALVGAVDMATGDNLTFVLFYLPAIALAAWVLGGVGAVIVATLSALMGFAATRAVEGGPAPHVDAANAIFRWTFFLIFAYGSTLLRHLVENLERRAGHDELTGLQNRRAFYERVETDRQRARRSGRPLSILYIDLDNLKVVNDREGHEGGDRLLRLFTQRVQSVLRPTDWFARLGGDEFAIALAETDADTACEVATRLQRELRRPDPEGLVPSGSIGCATFVTVPTDVEAMVRAADRLMYQAKEAERGSIRAAVVGDPRPDLTALPS